MISPETEAVRFRWPTARCRCLTVRMGDRTLDLSVRNERRESEPELISPVPDVASPLVGSPTVVARCRFLRSYATSSAAECVRRLVKMKTRPFRHRGSSGRHVPASSERPASARAHARLTQRRSPRRTDKGSWSVSARGSPSGSACKRSSGQDRRIAETARLARTERRSATRSTQVVPYGSRRPYTKKGRFLGLLPRFIGRGERI